DMCAEAAAYTGVFPYTKSSMLPFWVGYAGSVNDEYVTTAPDALPANWAVHAAFAFSGNPGAGYAVTPPGDALGFNCSSDGAVCVQSGYEVPAASAPVTISTFGINAVDFAAVLVGFDGDRLFADGFQGPSASP